MKKMAKISTLTAMSLVLWLAMLVGSSCAAKKVESWAEWSSKGLGFTQKNEMGEDGEQRLTEEEVGAWLNVLHGAEVALEANKFQTAMAMVAGVVKRIDSTNWSDEQKRAKLKEMLVIIEKAVEADNKVKAIALINSIQADFNRRHGGRGGGGGQQRGLLEAEDEQKKKQMVAKKLREAFEAIKEEQMDKAEQMVNIIYQLIRDKEDLSKEEKTMAFLAALHKTEEYIKEDARDKAEQTLQGAAFGLGLSAQFFLEQKLAAGSKVEDEDEEENDTSQEKKKQMLETFLRQAFTAIKGEQRAKAEEILTTIYHLLKNNKSLAKEEKAIKFLQAIEETEKYVKEDAKEKAEQVLQGAAFGLGIQHISEQVVRNRKTGASGSEL